MQTVTINDARAFSLHEVQRRELLRSDDLHVELLCFEAGQRDGDVLAERERLYQVLEGEVIVHGDGPARRLGKGTLLSVPGGTSHALENAGGGLLVVMATGAG